MRSNSRNCVRACTLALSVSLGVVAAPALAAETLYLPSEAGYAKDALIPRAVEAECALPQKLIQFTREYARGDFDALETAGKAPSKGRFLKLEITHVEGAGGGAWSGAKSVTIRGSLQVDGKPGASFAARRISGGGAFGGFKGTCAILGRDVKALGKDVADWLRSPVDGARLGDL